jgi:hypothetical protein
MDHPQAWEAIMEEVKIHSGTRVKLKRINETHLEPDFLERLRDFAHRQEEIEAVFLFAIEAEGAQEHPAMAIAMREHWLSRKSEEFLRLVDEIQLLLPADFAVNVYRFDASDIIAHYCLDNLQPLYLRSEPWLKRQKKKLG